MELLELLTAAKSLQDGNLAAEKAEQQRLLINSLAEEIGYQQFKIQTLKDQVAALQSAPDTTFWICLGLVACVGVIFALCITHLERRIKALEAAK